jgi:hypothetical protein
MYYNSSNIQKFKNLKMPRRLPLRPAKVAGNIFVMVLFTFIGFIYYVYVVQCWGPKWKD